MGNLFAREIRKSAISILLKLLIQTTVCLGIAISFLYLTTLAATIDDLITSEQWGYFLASAPVDVARMDALGIEDDHLYYARGADESEVVLRSGYKRGSIKANECLFYSAKNVTATSFFRRVGGFYEITESETGGENQVILSADLAEYAGVSVGDTIRIQYRGEEMRLTISSTFLCDGDKYSLILPCAGIEGWTETASDCIIGTADPQSHLSLLEKAKKKGVSCQDGSGIVSVRERTIAILWILGAVLATCVLLMFVIQWRQNKQLLRDREKHIEVLYMCGYSPFRTSVLYVAILAAFHVLMGIVVGGLFSAAVYYINHVLEEFFVITQPFAQKFGAVLLSVGISLLIDGLTGAGLYRRMKKQYGAE